MKETERGMLIPFELSATRMRRSAQEYRRRGQVLEALSLVRRAAEQEDSAAGWQALAAEMRQLGCWESAAVLLARVLSREEHAPSDWLDMAICQEALGREALAADCLYHLLQEDPWSSEGDRARAMLPRLEPEGAGREPKRLQRLIHRGLNEWRTGDRALGMRRLRRAVRLADKRAGLMTTIALLRMLEERPRSALRWLSRALREKQDDVLVLCTLAAVCAQLGQNRAARGFLRLAAPLCTGPAMEERFFTTAWAMDAWPEMERWLEQQLRRYPHRTRLLAMKAALRCEQGERQEAQQLWRLILSIDPGDRAAATLLRWTQEYPMNPLPAPGQLPLPIVLEQRSTLLDREADPAALLRPGSPERRVMDWCAASQEEDEQRLALLLAKEQPDREAEKCFLRELLTRPDVQEAMRQQALARLAELRCFEPLTVLMGDRFTVAQCQPIRKRRGPWRVILPLLLRETRSYDDNAQIIGFAADIWRGMTAAERQETVMKDAFLWCKAVEALWLQAVGAMDRAERLLRELPVNPRRVERLMRRLTGAAR